MRIVADQARVQYQVALGFARPSAGGKNPASCGLRSTISTSMRGPMPCWMSWFLKPRLPTAYWKVSPAR